jgi:metal-responsive CopG/Arc/MetJ family transcriptional regulator
MRRKTSVSLTEELLQEIGRVGGRRVNRSEFLEKAAWERVALLKRLRRDARDRALLAGKARASKSDAIDVLEYQADW